MKKWIPILLSAAAALLSVAAEPRPMVVEGFSDPALFEISPAVGRISEDGKRLLVDTTGSAGNWRWIWRTRAGVLKPGTGYVAEFRYRIENPDPTKYYFYILSRPVSADHPNYDTLRQRLGDAGTFQKVRLRFRTGAAADSAFQIHTYRKLRGEITDFTLTEEAGERYYPATAGAQPFTGSLGKLPTGAREFEVERPKNPDGKSLNAADFGVSSDNPDNVPALNRALEACRKDGAARLVLAPGVYRMTSDRAVSFDGLRDFEFDGGGATLLFLKKRDSNFRVRNCERVVLRNFNFDWDWEVDPLASVVEVVGVAPGTVDFKFVEYDRFPRRDLRIAIISSYDPATKSVGIEGGFDQGFEFTAGRGKAKTQWLSDNVLRVQMGNSDAYRPGQFFRMQHYYYDMHGIIMSDNRHLTLEDVNIYSCAGHAITVGGTQQYWQFLRVCIAVPEGVPRRAITCTADHCHIAQSRGFFKMEECEFSRGADDCLNAHDCSGFAVKSGPDSLTSRRNYRPGTLLELRHADYSPTGVKTRVRESRPSEAKPGAWELVLSEPVPDPIAAGEGFVLFDWSYDTRNIIIRNNRFHNNRARGLLLLGRDITIEGNRFFHNEMGAIKIETGYTLNSWCEGFGVDNVVVRNNEFDSVNPRDIGNDGRARDIYIGVYLKSDPSTERTDYPILSNILFEKNTFKDSFGLVAFISSAGNVTFRDNTIWNPTPRRLPLPFRGGFYVTAARGVRIVNNRYVASPNMPKPGVYADAASVRDLVVAGNVVVSEAPEKKR